MAACDVLKIFMTQKVIDSPSEVSGDSTKPTKMIAEQKSIFGQTVKMLFAHKGHL